MLFSILKSPTLSLTPHTTPTHNSAAASYCRAQIYRHTALLHTLFWHPTTDVPLSPGSFPSPDWLVYAELMWKTTDSAYGPI